MKTKIAKIVLLYSLIITIVAFICVAAYNSFLWSGNRIVYIKGHEYIESGFRNTHLIHSESCKHKSHKND